MLATRGAELVVRRGPRAATIVALAREARCAAVCWSAAYDSATIEADRIVQAALEEAGFRVAVVHDAPAVTPDDTASVRHDDDGTGYRSFAPYFAAWRAAPRSLAEVRPTFVSLALGAEALSAAVDGLPGGERTGPLVSERSVLAAFDAYLAGPGLAYRSARNVPASDATARLSAALAFGLISARTLLARIDARAADTFLLAEERASLDELRRALARRDFFLQLGWFFEREPDAPLQARMRNFGFAASHPAIDAWRLGRTGHPLVDAGTRQLIATGWMHPRVRPVVASFLCFDLGVDWRVGRDAWDRWLVEDEPALATGNWQWVAGVGADLAQIPRIFNPWRQARYLDPLGDYVRRWIPELADLPDLVVREPARVAADRRMMLPLFDGAAYPAPIVDHASAARAYLARYAAFVRD